MSTLQLWNSYMTSYDFLMKVDSYSKNLEDIAAAIPSLRAKRVLDAGSGTGNLSLILKRNGADVISCDISETAIAQHREKDPSATILRLSLEDPLPMEDANFDVICCASVLFALKKDGCRLALSEFFRVLRPSGKLIVTVAAPDQRNGNLLKMHLRASINRFGWVRGAVHGFFGTPAITRIMYYNRALRRIPDWQGYHRFSTSELHGMIEDAGFQRTTIKRTYGENFLLAIAEKME